MLVRSAVKARPSTRTVVSRAKANRGWRYGAHPYRSRPLTRSEAIAYIKWVGTHAEYDDIDAEEV